MKNTSFHTNIPTTDRWNRRKIFTGRSAWVFALMLLSTVILLPPARPQSFQELINRIGSLPESRRQAIADSFVNSVPSMPFLENDSVVHFIYNNPARSVALSGDVTGYKPSQNLTCIQGTHLWYYTTFYPTDARLDYKFVTNGSDWILDPKNPLTCMSGFGPNSELRMPGYHHPPEIFLDSTIPHGTLIDTTCFSAGLGNTREVKIYLPAGYPQSGTSYPLVLFHDGTDYVSLCNARNILDYLIANRLITPVIAVFIPPVDRTAEYSGDKINLFTTFITHELMPAIDARFHTSKDPSKRAMIGASNGGNIALYISVKHPEAFRMAGAQSSNVIPAISQSLRNLPKLPLNFYLDLGTYDIEELIPLVNNLKNILESKNYPLEFHEWHEGHSWGNWMGHLRLPLIRFFPYITDSK